MHLLLLLALAQEPFQVDGLRDGERSQSLASSAEVTDTDQRYGRVVDAHTGFPVANATIETWTEEISGAAPGFQRIGSAKTARDGGFQVRIQDDGLPAEKILVRAPGHLTFPGTVADLDLVPLLPKPEWTPSIQVLDFEGRPIADARITSTYSCAHDVPAFELTTGPDGIVELPEFGLQDHPGELRIRARGFAARKYIDLSEVPADPVDGRPAIVRLARQGGLRARVLTGTGEPLAERALYVVEGDGFHVPTTDARGGFRIEACYEPREATIQVLAPENNAHVFSGALPLDREVALRVEADGWPHETPVGTITIRTDQGQGERIQFGLFHADGWALSSAMAVEEPRELEFPAGSVLILVGAPFSGWEPQLVEIELRANEAHEVTLIPDPEPELEILTPPGEAQRVVIQAGGRSIELEPEDGRALTHVPADAPLIVLSEGTFDRRATLAPLSGNGTLDLRERESLLPATRAQLLGVAPRGKLDVRISPAGTGTLTARGEGDPAVERTGPGEFTVDAPAGYPVLLHYEAGGFADCWTSTYALDGQRRELALTPTRLASLAIENATAHELVVEGPEAERLDELHPGPLSLILTLSDGRRGKVALELAPGEARVLTLRD